MKLSELRGLAAALARDFVLEHRQRSIDTDRAVMIYLSSLPEENMLPPMIWRQGHLQFSGTKEISISMLCTKSTVIYFALRTLCTTECYARSYIPGVGWSVETSSLYPLGNTMTSGHRLSTGEAFDKLQEALLPLCADADKAVAEIISDIEADVKKNVLDRLFSDNALSEYADSLGMDFDAGGALIGQNP